MALTKVVPAGSTSLTLAPVVYVALERLQDATVHVLGAREERSREVGQRGAAVEQGHVGVVLGLGGHAVEHPRAQQQALLECARARQRL